MSLSKHRLALATGLPALLNWYHRSRILVVTYHGVYDGQASAHRFPDTFVHIDQMAAQLRFLKRHYRILRPAELLEAIRSRTVLPDHAALVTFDDAYANFDRLAVPVLKELDIQPIVFVPTYYAEKQEPFWYDVIWLYFRRTPRLHLDLLEEKLGTRLPLSGNGEGLGLSLGILKRLEQGAREPVMQGIRAAIADCGVDMAAAAADFLAMTPDRIQALSGQGICFGGHTHSHTILTSMPDDSTRREIDVNKSLLESWLGKPVHFFAYPNGGAADFNDRHKQMLLDAGYAAAFSLTQHRSSHLEDPMSISRLHVAPEDTLEAVRLRCTGATPLINCIRRLMART